MKNKRYLPVNLAGLALTLVLWQAEARAHTGRQTERKRYFKAHPVAHRKTGRHVVKRQHTSLQSRGRMRQRALVYEPFIAAAARKYGVDPRALWTIAYLETRFRADQVSPKGARGLMQFIPSTGKRFNLTNPFDALQSIDSAARYASELTKQFDGRLDLVLAGYNSGETTVDCFLKGRTVRTRSGKLINPRGIKTGGVPPYPETQRYVRRGVLVFSRVTSAAVFSPELLSITRMLRWPTMTISRDEQVAVDRELVDLRGVPATVLFSTKAVNANLGPAVSALRADSSFDMVFFDVHSGARYLVKSGEIIKPLERMSETPRENLSENGVGYKAVSKSVYLGSRED